MNAALLIALIAALFLLRQPLLIILLSVTAYVHLVWGQGDLTYIIDDMWRGIDKEVILAIPLFILCGNVMTRGSIAERIVNILTAVTAPIPGGLAVACIFSCAAFASISGSSIVTMLAVGSVLYPGLIKAGYDNRFALGAIMSGGTLGIIIPPSIPMIIYAFITESSIPDLFLAGVGPGLLLTVALSTYSWFVNRHMPARPLDVQELAAALRRGIWAMLMPVILLGGIYTGWFTPTESAAVALGYSILVEVFIHRELKLKDFYTVVVDASKLGGSLFPVLAVALSLNLIMVENRVVQDLVRLMQEWITSPAAFMVLVNLLLLVVGCLMDINSAILVLAPLLAPLAAVYGYDKIVFGLIMILNLEIGFLTPPVGLNLIVAMTAFKQPFGLLCRAALPFITIMLVCLVLVIWQPIIAMYLVRRAG